MKVAYIVNQYPAASHTFIRREINALERKGITVLRTALRSGDKSIVDERDQLEKKKTQYILQQSIWRIFTSVLKAAISRPRGAAKALHLAIKVGARSDRGMIHHIVYLAEACVLADWIIKENIKHIHAHFGTNSTTVAMLAAEITTGTFSFTVHGPEEFDKAEFIGLPEKIRKAKFVAAITSYCRSQLYRMVGFEHWHKIHLIRCGLDASYFEAPVEKNTASNLFVCVGRLCEQKGQLLLVEAVHQVIQQGRSMRLVLAGDGPLRPELEKRIAELKLEDSVSITGWVDTNQIQKLLADSRVMILPSFAEGLPVVIMEALSVRRPVITTYIAGIPELVAEGENGWLVPAGCKESLVHSIHTAMDASLEHLENMGKAGCEAVKKFHNIDLEGAKLARLLEAAP